MIRFSESLSSTNLSAIRRILSSPFYYGLMKFNDELHQGNHDPLISKNLFETVARELDKRMKPHGKRKHLFAFLGLAHCGQCGCSITAERQRGHHYYRCTKKKGVCTEMYLREEKLAEQVQAAIQRVALPKDIYQKMLAAWAQEKEEATQPLAPHKKEITHQTDLLQRRIDRLLEVHLDRLITQTEYKTQKEKLLQEKIALQEKLASLEEGANGWLEHFREFLDAAYYGPLRAMESDLESQKKFLKKIGSNIQVTARTLRFSYKKPWQHLATSPFPLENNKVGAVPAIKKYNDERDRASRDFWRPQRESNPCRRRERAVSLATRRWGQCFFVSSPRFQRFKDPKFWSFRRRKVIGTPEFCEAPGARTQDTRLKRAVLYQLS
jgi:hypothetical protein